MGDGLVRVAVGFAIASMVFAAPAEADYLPFVSPSQNISCEVDYQRDKVPDVAFCATNTPPESATLDDTGVLSTCSGENCVGNAPQNSPTLAFGKTTASGPFTCRSEVDSVTCTVTSGRGFSISSSGITPVG